MRALLSPSLLTLSLLTSLSLACLDNDEGIDDGTDEAAAAFLEGVQQQEERQSNQFGGAVRER